MPRTPGPQSPDPFSPLLSPRTPGPLGWNDAADPHTKSQTEHRRGPVGVHDAATLAPTNDSESEEGHAPIPLRMLQSMLVAASPKQKKKDMQPPVINFTATPPTVNKDNYRYAPFGLDKDGLRKKLEDYLRSKNQSEGLIQDLMQNWEPTVTGKINQAWKFITSKAATNKACNNYFKSLPSKKTLREILEDNKITVNLLVPKENSRAAVFNNAPPNFDKVVAANTTLEGPNIGLHPDLMIFPSDAPADAPHLKDYANVSELIRTLVHELAHVGGATTNQNDPEHGLDAENSLPACGCGAADTENRG